MKICYNSIGIIRTPFKKIEGMPIQPGGSEGNRGTIELKEEYTGGLSDLDKFSHIFLIYHFHKSSGFKLSVIPFLDNKPHGLFATRAPKRPNPIGISVVRLLNIKGNILTVENVDMLDGTPLLDIKPFVSQFDIHEIDSNGWLSDIPGYKGTIKSDTRFK
ncbi:MAG TPA: tRNA (N6-threonylcarbamoyladenosine(37)-N6)-methyltransferase TrmO [Ignavibacteriaceae bacterium]|nr:tRNA (N6-threonylcarbamoyladenosine(37)-N6)-methyltransferase TrmO [Ignavibacteriaceae bacterium]